MARRYRAPLKFIGPVKHFFYRLNTFAHGFPGSTRLLNIYGTHVRTILEMRVLQKAIHLVYFTTETHHNYAGKIGMAGITCKGPLE